MGRRTVRRSPHKRVYGQGVNDYLRPAELGAFLGLKERRTRTVLGELEALGFKLEAAAGGVRLCPPQVAAAVKAYRAQGRELSALRLDPSMTPFLARDSRGVEPSALDVLIFTAVEVAIVREAVGALSEALTTGAARSSYRALSFTNAGLPDPRNGL